MAGDVLSQNEIDALLSAISTGEMDADELKKEEQQKKVFEASAAPTGAESFSRPSFACLTIYVLILLLLAPVVVFSPRLVANAIVASAIYSRARRLLVCV